MFVLPKVPSFGEEFAQNFTQGLSRGIETGSNLVSQAMKERAKRGPTLAESLSAFSKSNPPSNPLLSTPNENESRSQSNFSSIFNNPQVMDYLIQNNPEAAEQVLNIQKGMADVEKSRSDVEEKKRERKGVEDSLDRLEVLSKDYSKSPFSGKAGIRRQIPFGDFYQGAQELDTAGIWSADAVYTHFNKGVLNKEKWEDVKSRFAPSSKLTWRENKARIDAMKRIMGMSPNSSPGKVDKMIDAELRHLKKTEKPSLESFYE